MNSDNLLNELSQVLEGFEHEMKITIEERGVTAPVFREMIFHHFGWSSDGDPRIQSKGKRIRPLITMLVAKALGGNDFFARNVGIALELMHNFTIVHDDIMDQSLERRHRPTVWSLWGSSQAINAGDGLFALSYLGVLNLEDQNSDIPPKTILKIIKSLTVACLDTVEGQILDIGFESKNDVMVEECIKMISNKSGSLISCSAQCGALISTDDKSTIENYTEFGRNLGIAFQIRDDYLGIWGDESVTGKTSGIDIIERKKSLPIIWALNQKSDQTKIIRSIYAQDQINIEDVSTVTNILTDLGSDKYTIELATQYYDKALEYLHKTNIKNKWQDTIVMLSDFLINRNH
jgi:geranylgeranyl diphosphate synthase, type I